MKLFDKLKEISGHWRKSDQAKKVALTPKQKRKEKERIATIWFSMAFLISMFIVGHLYEIPLMTYDKDATPIRCKQKNSTAMTDIPPPLAFDQQNETSISTESTTITTTTTTAPQGDASTTTTEQPSDVIMKLTMKESLEIENQTGVKFSTYSSMKFFFQVGLIAGGFSLGHIVDFFGRKSSFKILSRSFIIFVLLMSISRTIATTGICWFLLGYTLVTNYHMIYINAIEKFSDIYEKPNDEEDETLKTRYKKYKYRMYLLLGFGFTWNFSRLFALLIPYLTQDWTLILQWYAIIFSVLYYFFGDFMEDHYEDEDVLKKEKELCDEDCEGMSFYQAMRARPIMAMNVFILSFNWFAVCHNLFGLVLGWASLAESKNLLENMSVATAFSFLAQPIKFGICMAIKRKVIPYSLTMFSSGIIIMSMLAFEHCGEYQVNPRIIAAHVASVLLSVSIGILEPLLYENIPKKYRIHAAGIASACGRFGILIAGILSQFGLFKTDFGPAFGGTLSIVGAILSRILPDLTTSRMPKTQAEIEKEQFPNRAVANHTPQSLENGPPTQNERKDTSENEPLPDEMTVLPNEK